MIDNNFYIENIYNKIINFYKKKTNPILIKLDNNESNLLFKKICKWLLCNFKINLKYCNKCKDCNFINLEIHPDNINLYIFNKINNVNYIEIIKSHISNKLIYSKFKIICIHNIDILDNKSIIILSKIIEESNELIFFIFSCLNYENVNKFLKNRCIIWFIDSFKLKILTKIISNKLNLLNFKKIKTSLKINNNNIIKTIDLLNKENWNKRCIFFNFLIKSFINKKFINLLFLFKKSSNEIYNPMLWFIILIIDSIKVKNNIFFDIKNIDKLNLIKNISNLNSNDILNKILKELIYCYYYSNINKNVNRYIFIIKSLLFIELLLNNNNSIIVNK